MFRHHVPKTKPRLQQCSCSPSSSSTLDRALLLISKTPPLSHKKGVVTPTILWPIHSLKWDRNSWCDATLCVHLCKEKRQSKPDGKVHYFTSLSQCSTNPRVRLPVPTSVRGRSSVFGKRKSSREPCRPEDQGSRCETRIPGGHKVMRSS